MGGLELRVELADLVVLAWSEEETAVSGRVVIFV